MRSKKCSTPYCRNYAEKNGKYYRKFCSKCRARKKKKNNPLTYVYNYHKQNAKRRDIPWNLTKKEFKELWLKSGKWEEKLAGESWQMHRLESEEGYHKDNIVIIKKALHIQITAIEQGWEVSFRYRKKPKDNSKSKAPF